MEGVNPRGPCRGGGVWKGVNPRGLYGRKYSYCVRYHPTQTPLLFNTLTLC